MRKLIFFLVPIAGFLLFTGAGSKMAVARVKKEETKNPVEERRQLHLNIIKVFFDDVYEPQSRISLGIRHKANPKVIRKYTEKKKQTGTYVQTQFNVLICEASPCEQQWSASFNYTDETGKQDAFDLAWKQTVFEGITPKGTSKREMLVCLNKECKSLEDTGAFDAFLVPQTAVIGRYHITWSKSSLVIRRSDILKEVTDAGGTAEAY
jgi:hypothetical protein